ncbi:MAG TPA: YdeI/OmpD-associated family protein [Rhodothermales bacterium]
MKPVDDGLPVLHFETQAALEAWLDEHHESADGVWLRFAKKGSGQKSVTYDEAVELGLCFGWIDGQSRSLDDTFWLQRFTPRRKRSKWSKLNCEKALELIRQGRMRPAGLAAVDAAKADGRWDAAYASPKNIEVPEDLQRRLDENPKAKAFFETLSGSNRYAILYRIHDAKKPETRERRIEKFVGMLERGEKIYG